MSNPVYITDSLILGHIIGDPAPDSGWNDQDLFATSQNNLVERHIEILDQPQRAFGFTWRGVESVYTTLRDFRLSRRFKSWYFYYPISEDWTGHDLACGFPETILGSALPGGAGLVTGTFTGITKAADTVLTVANTFAAIADHVYVYITGVVDNGPGGDLEAALNGKLHEITEYTSAASFKIATDTSGCTNTWVSGGTAALCTFVIPGRSTSAHVVKEAGTTKTLTTHYTIAAGEGLGDEDVIQCTTAWIPANAAAVTCAFTGRRRHHVRFTDNHFACPPSMRRIGGSRLYTLPFNLKQMFTEIV